MRYDKYEQKLLDQEAGRWLDENCKQGIFHEEWQALLSEVREVLNITDNETLDRWERERYNELLLRETEERANVNG